MIEVAALSLQGKRSSNQDRVLVYPGSGTDVVAAVADGLGGMQAGDEAAQIAVDTINETAKDLLAHAAQEFDPASRFVAEVCQRANDRIADWAEANVGEGAVGTTLVMLIVSGRKYMVANVGDSRCYLVNDEGAVQITQDHTVADSLVRKGILSLADYDSSPLRNRLTRSLGPQPVAEPDIFPPGVFGNAASRSTFLLCSDGFYGKLKDADFMKLQDATLKLQDILDSLASTALERDSTDNVSAVAIRFDFSR